MTRTHRCPTSPPGRAGVSLVEVLMVIVLIAVTAFPLYDIMITSERGNASSVERMRATNFAAELLETLKAVPYAQLPLTEEVAEPGWPDTEVADHTEVPDGSELDQLIDLGARFEPVTGAVEGFSRYLSIRPVSRRGDGAETGDLKEIVVTIRWKERMSRGQTESELVVAFLHAPRREVAP